MNPGDIVGALGWVGWIFGIVAGALQIQQWRRERRIGPAKEKLFEEALRDRKGQYTDEQIHDLTLLMRKLERATKEDIPRQARRVYIENQLQEISQSLETNVNQYEILSKELARVTSEHRELPVELSQAVEATIASPFMELRRRQRRLFVLVVVGLLVSLYPEIFEYTVSFVTSSFGLGYLSIGVGNLLLYVLGSVVASSLMFIIFGRKTSIFIRRHILASLSIIAVTFTAWATCTFIVYRSITEAEYRINDETSTATLSVLLLSLLIRIATPIVASMKKVAAPTGRQFGHEE